MTSTTLNYLSAIGAIACLILPAKDLITNIEKKGIRRITPIGWALLLTAIYIAVISVATINKVDSEKQEDKRLADSTRKAESAQLLYDLQTALKEQNLVYNPKEGKVYILSKKSSVNPEIIERPLLDVQNSFDTPNPTITPTGKPNQFVLKIATESLNDFIITYPRAVLNMIHFKNSNILEKYNSTTLFNKSVKIQKSTKYLSDNYFTLGADFNLSDTLLVYWKMEYNNVNNKPQPSLRKLYYFVPNHLKAPLDEPDDKNYDFIKSLLIKKHLW